MPGRIVAVEVCEGQAVMRGQKLLALEAMKMEQILLAPFDGVVANLKGQPERLDESTRASVGCFPAAPSGVVVTGAGRPSD